MNLMEIYRVEVGLFLLGLLLLLGSKMATGKILLRGMFGDVDGVAKVNPERVLLFAVTILIAVGYGVRLVLAGADRLPELGMGWLALFGASCVIYAVTKAFRTFRAKS